MVLGITVSYKRFTVYLQSPSINKVVGITMFFELGRTL